VFQYCAYLSKENIFSKLYKKSTTEQFHTFSYSIFRTYQKH